MSADQRLQSVALSAEEAEGARSVRARLKGVALRTLVGDAPLTIVSNNCWGAHIYQALGLPYTTPFVGLFIPPRSFLTLVNNFDELMGAELRFVPESGSPQVNAWREREGLSYPIGLLGGCVEIDFQHYASEVEAAAKWRRRVGRMAPDRSRRFFKFDDREGATAGDIEAFGKARLAHKVCFTARPYATPTVLMPAADGEAHVVDGLSLAQASRARFNVVRWISVRPEWLPLPSLI